MGVSERRKMQGKSGRVADSSVDIGIQQGFPLGIPSRSTDRLSEEFVSPKSLVPGRCEVEIHDHVVELPQGEEQFLIRSRLEDRDFYLLLVEFTKRKLAFGKI